MTTITVSTRIKQLEVTHGSLRAAARVLKCNPGYLCRLKKGRGDASDALLSKMGLCRITFYKNKA